jgi:hypothetical protein
MRYKESGASPGWMTTSPGANSLNSASPASLRRCRFPHLEKSGSWASASAQSLAVGRSHGRSSSVRPRCAAPDPGRVDVVPPLVAPEPKLLRAKPRFNRLGVERNPVGLKTQAAPTRRPEAGEMGLDACSSLTARLLLAIYPGLPLRTSGPFSRRTRVPPNQKVGSCGWTPSRCAGRRGRGGGAWRCRGGSRRG